MGEKVEQRLEKFVPTFEQLKKLGIFEQEEVKEIIRKRRSFEYSLQSKSVTLDTFLKYIQYESAVMELTNERKAQKGIDSNERLLSDIDWPRHIHSIYRMATQRFSGDLRVWNLYFDYCISSHHTKSLNTAFAQCVRLHSHDAELWIRAANWEMNDNGNTEYAKSLMEQAVKELPQNPKIYAAYAETVLHLAQQIKGRREIYGIMEEADTTKAPIVIYEKALTECPNKAEVYHAFKKVFEKYEQSTDDLMNKGIENGSPDILNYIAQQSEDPILSYKKFLESHKTRELQIMFAMYLGKQQNGKELIKVIDDIEDFDDNETEIFVEYLIDCNLLEDAADLLQDDLTTPKMQRLKLKLMNAQCGADVDKFISQSRLLLQKYNNSDMNSDFLFYCAKKINSADKWLDLIKSKVSFVKPDIIAKLFEFTHLKYGSDFTRQAIEQIMPTINPTPEFIKIAINVEQDQKVVDPAKIRALHDTNTSKWGKQNADVWLDYCDYEMKQKNVRRLEEIRRKANQALEDSSEFNREYQERFCKKQK